MVGKADPWKYRSIPRELGTLATFLVTARDIIADISFP